MGSEIEIPTILVVDDSPEEIDILTGLLSRTYQIKAALSGERAFELATSNEAYDLILLDIVLPGMDGFEVCKRIKQNRKTRDIPIIFITSQNDVTAEMKGLQLGALDYITKPFNPAIVQTRVKTHMELSRSRTELNRLLEKTLLGSITMLTDILSLVEPRAFHQATRLRQYACSIADHLHLPGSWQFEMAALLSHIGCITLPSTILDKVYVQKKLSMKENVIFLSHPLLGYDLIAQIPQLEIVAKIIKYQLDPFEESKQTSDIRKWDPVLLGGQILRTIIDYDKLVMKGLSCESAISQMKSELQAYPDVLLRALKNTQMKILKALIQCISFNQLRAGMMLMEDIVTEDGVKLLGRGTVVSASLIIILKRFSERVRIREPIRILMMTE